MKMMLQIVFFMNLPLHARSTLSTHFVLQDASFSKFHFHKNLAALRLVGLLPSIRPLTSHLNFVHRHLTLRTHPSAAPASCIQHAAAAHGDTARATPCERSSTSQTVAAAAPCVFLSTATRPARRRGEAAPLHSLPSAAMAGEYAARCAAARSHNIVTSTALLRNPSLCNQHRVKPDTVGLSPHCVRRTAPLTLRCRRGRRPWPGRFDQSDRRPPILPSSQPCPVYRVNSTLHSEQARGQGRPPVPHILLARRTLSPTPLFLFKTFTSLSQL